MYFMGRWHDAQLINPDNDIMCYPWSLRFFSHKLLTVEEFPSKKLMLSHWNFLHHCGKQSRLLNSLFRVLTRLVILLYDQDACTLLLPTPGCHYFLNMRNWTIISSLYFPWEVHSSTWSRKFNISVIYLKEKETTS